MEAKIEEFKIILDDGPMVYEIGDSIKGRCVVSDAIARNARVNIVLNCRGEVKWIEPGPHTRYRHHHHDHLYNEKANFLEAPYKYSEEDVEVNHGVITIPFQFHLTESLGLPSSFEGVHGFVRYWISAYLGTHPETATIHAESCIVKVFAPIKKNLLLPIGSNTEKDVGYLFGKGTVHMYAAVAKKGFYPGEKIPIEIIIQNDSSTKVQPRATIYEERIFLARNRHHSVEKHFENVLGEPAEPEKDSHDIILIEVPDVPLSMKTPLMVVKYFLHVTLDIPYEIDVHINLPIVITTKRALMESEQEELN